jgi:hypothetical protein
MANLSSFYPQPVIAGTTAGTFAEGNAPRIIDVTHAELLSLMGAQNLKRGFHYRITDFVTEYMANDNSDGLREWISPSNTANVSLNNGTAFTVASIAATPEPLIVYAFSSSEVSEEAYSELYPKDIIHYDPELTYLDGTHTAKGFITYRKDTVREIACDYDWRNVRFKRWKLDPTATTNFAGGTTTAISPLATSTSYNVGDVVTLGTSANNAGVLLCVKKHTSPSTITTFGYLPTYDPNAWIPFFNRVRGFIHTPALLKPSYNGAGVYLGGYGQASYLYTFSESNGTASTSAASAITITRPTESLAFSDRYSLSFNNIVIVRAATGSTIFAKNLELANCNDMTLYGISEKGDCVCRDSFNLYIDGTFQKNELVDATNSFFLSDTRGCRIYNFDECIIHGKVTDAVIESLTSCCIGRNSLQSRFFNCRNVSFIAGDSEKRLVVENPLELSNGRALYLQPFLQQGISGLEQQASDVKVTVGFIKIPHYEYRDENENLARVSVYGTTPILSRHADDAVTTRLQAATEPSFKSIFTTQDHATPTYVRNTDCWCYDLAEEMTCISPWNSASGSPSGVTGGGTLITPRHIYMAAHFKIPVGATIRFVTADNEVVDRELVASYTHPSYVNGNTNFDVTVGLLASDVPASITPAQTLPPNFNDYFIDQAGGLYLSRPPAGALYTDQEEKALVIDHIASNSDIHDFYPPISTLKLSAFETLVTGDSSNPVFFIINDKLVLLAAWSAVREGGSAFGWDYSTPLRANGSSKAPLLQAMIDAVDAAYGVSTGHQLDLVDLSSFVKFTTS